MENASSFRFCDTNYGFYFLLFRVVFMPSGISFQPNSKVFYIEDQSRIPSCVRSFLNPFCFCSSSFCKKKSHPINDRSQMKYFIYISYQ
uniref:Uncharacterized protein n=1 Tax=Lepeophtheirus salmonis TaxID=72036 RepID=A0A0K2TY69_LEPSM